jgi:hypothetical protein
MYAYEMDVARPLEEYDRIHAEIEGRTGDLGEQCLLHLVTRTDSGFRVIDVWETHEAADRWGDEVMRPAVERVFGAETTAGGPPPSRELEVHQLQVGRHAEAMT